MSEPEEGSIELQIVGDGPGVYANLCGVSVNAEEACLHFLQRTSPSEAFSVVKVYTSVPHAQRIAAALIKTLLEHKLKGGPSGEEAPSLTDTAAALDVLPRDQD